MASEKKQISNSRYYSILITGLFFIFIFGYLCPVWGTVTRTGVQCIGIFIGSVLLLCTGYGAATASLLGLFAILLTGYYDSKSIVAATLGSTTVFQLCMIYCLCASINDCGAGEVIARWMISRKQIQGRPLLFTFIFFTAMFLGGVLIGTTGTIIFCYTIVNSIRETLGYDKNSRWYKWMLLGSYASTCVGSPVLPFKGIALIIFSSVTAAMAEAGIALDYGSYMIPVILFAILFVIMLTLSMKYLFRVDLSKLEHLDITKMEGMDEIRLNRKQVVILTAFIIGILYTIVLLFLPKSMPGYKMIAGIGQHMWFAFIIAALALVRLDKETIFNPEKYFKIGVSWGIVLAVCLFSVLGGMLSAEDIGFKAWIQVTLQPVFGNMPFFWFMAVVFCITCVITNFFSNTAIGLIMTSISAPFVIQYIADLGINGSVVTAAIATAAMMAYLTMAASGTAPLLHAQEAIQDDPKFVWTDGLGLLALFIVLGTVVFSAFAFIL